MIYSPVGHLCTTAIKDRSCWSGFAHRTEPTEQQETPTLTSPSSDGLSDRRGEEMSLPCSSLRILFSFLTRGFLFFTLTFGGTDWVSGCQRKPLRGIDALPWLQAAYLLHCFRQVRAVLFFFQQLEKILGSRLQLLGLRLLV